MRTQLGKIDNSVAMRDCEAKFFVKYASKSLT